MNEIVFLVEEAPAPEGGFTAKALGYSIFTDAETVNELHAYIHDAVSCHFEITDKPIIIRLHFVREEIISTCN